MPITIQATRDRAAIAANYAAIRKQTEDLCAPLEADDYLLQYDAECSPPKWQLAHTTWFFETFLLKDFLPGYEPFHPAFAYLFNSYYEAAGPRWARAKRGLLSRPTTAAIYAYRTAIDARVRALIQEADDETLTRMLPILDLGLNHEQQHQELLLTDIKPAFACNPLRPIYMPANPSVSVDAPTATWKTFPAGVYEIGHTGEGFHFDNEGPRHRVFLEAFAVGNDAVTTGEYLAFVEDGGYRRPELWLSDGWATCKREGWDAPLYWSKDDGEWAVFTLGGMKPLDVNAPIAHLSFYEADAFARWAGVGTGAGAPGVATSLRLPTEAEWEVAAGEVPATGNFLESDRLDPASEMQESFFGNVWQWTASPYVAYPGYRPVEGALGEYNGKFMCNQMVLRGGSCFTPRSHIRRTYRNFFPPETRRQMAGLRLAKDVTA